MNIIKILKELRIFHVSAHTIPGEFDPEATEGVARDSEPNEQPDKSKKHRRRNFGNSLFRVIVTILGAILVVISAKIGFWNFLLMFIFWGGILYIIWKYKSLGVLLWVIFFGSLIISLLISEIGRLRVILTEVEVDGNKIVIQGESGILRDGGSHTDINEKPTTREHEVYLVEGGASVTYTLNIIQAGRYKITAALADDGEHSNGDLNVLFKFETGAIQYNHENFRTEKYREIVIGEIELNSGIQDIIITKNETTPAEFAMDYFILEKI